MGMRPPRMCSKCYAIALPGERLCAAHKVTVRQSERDRKKSPLQKLYNRRAWRLTRDQVLSDDPQCAFVDSNGVRFPLLATEVHHKIRAEEWVAMDNDFHDSDNLEGVCKAHHSRYTAHEVGFGG
jgi:hypothetical protein